jgi:hypothetical protein
VPRNSLCQGNIAILSTRINNNTIPNNREEGLLLEGHLQVGVKEKTIGMIEKWISNIGLILRI